jgi:hypothetical protein
MINRNRSILIVVKHKSYFTPDFAYTKEVFADFRTFEVWLAQNFAHWQYLRSKTKEFWAIQDGIFFKIPKSELIEIRKNFRPYP